MPARGPTLSFDPHYVDFLISAWGCQDLTPLALADLQRLTSEYAQQHLDLMTMMGLAEHQVKRPAITSAINLLKSLKLAKQTSSGPKNAKVVTVSVTSLGSEVLNEKPAAGSIRVGLVGLLIDQSPPLRTLLHAFHDHGPLSRPIAHPRSGTPRKGTAFNRALLEGLASYVGTVHSLPPRSAARKTASQQLAEVSAQVAGRHPVSALPSAAKLVLLAIDLGLLWRDVEQVNSALGIEIIGTAATARDGTIVPLVPDWRESQTRFAETLWQVYLQRVDSSGFATIEALRGGIGRELAISGSVVDAFLCRARDLGDGGDYPLTLQFEPDDDLLYSSERKPLIWQESAFDFVEVHQRVPGTLQTTSLASSGRPVGLSPTP